MREHTADSLTAAVEETRQAYYRAVDFLSTQIHVSGAEILPYSNQLTVLAEIFRRVPSPTPDQHDAIRLWFWRTAAAGYFSGWNTGMMAADVRAIANFANGTADFIGVEVVKPSADTWISRQFRSNNAHAKLLAIILAHLGPVDLLSGQVIDTAASLSWSNNKEFHHFFPRDYLKNAGISAGRINSLTNIIMLTSASNRRISNRAPSDYLADVEKAAGSEQLQPWLDSNLVPLEAFEAAKLDDFGLFLTLRAQAIQRTVYEMAGWELPDPDSQFSLDAADSPEALEADAASDEYTVELPAGDAIAAASSGNQS